MTKKMFFFAFIALLFTGFTFIACNDDNNGKDDPDVPTVDPDDPSKVAEDNLIAYFAFEGDGKCEISGMTPSNAGTPHVTFPVGRRGQGFQGTADAASGLLYALPTDSELRDLKAVSVAFWIRTAPNTIETGLAPEQMVFQISGDGDKTRGNLYFLQERNYFEHENPDLRNYGAMMFFFWKDDAEWPHQWGGDWFLNVTAPQWRHIVCTYDNVSSEFRAYINGILFTAFDGTPYEHSKRFQAPDVPLGDLKFNNAEHLAIGSWAELLKDTGLQDEPWASPLWGQLDELRFYNRGLTAAEVQELYDKEVLKANVNE